MTLLEKFKKQHNEIFEEIFPNVKGFTSRLINFESKLDEKNIKLRIYLVNDLNVDVEYYLLVLKSKMNGKDTETVELVYDNNFLESNLLKRFIKMNFYFKRWYQNRLENDKSVNDVFSTIRQSLEENKYQQLGIDLGIISTHDKYAGY